MHIVCALLLACEEPTPPIAPAEPSGVEAPAVIDAEPSEVAAPVAAPIPGVPHGVDLYDETTWSALSVADKDRMRAIRAELEYQRANAPLEPSRPPRPATHVSEHDRAPAREIDDRYRGASGDRRTSTDVWEARDTKLATATAVTGMIWAATVITAIVLQFAVVDAVADCTETVADGNDCSDELRAVRRAGAGVIVASVIAGGAGVGVLVSGITLGVHRNSRPVELSVLPLRVRF